MGTMPPPGGSTLGNILIQHERPNLCPKNLWELRGFAPRALQRMRWRPTLVQAFWKQSGLVAEFHYYCEFSIGTGGMESVSGPGQQARVRSC